MTLNQLEIDLPLEKCEELSTLLEEDALSVTWYEKKPEIWSLQVIYDVESEAQVHHHLNSLTKDEKIPEATPLQDKDWVEAVYRNSPPLTLGQFYIHGSHIENPQPKGLTPLCINAATAFGSGQHESTEGCLIALSRLAKDHSFKKPLDMGCGSGILALAMASQWKNMVLACDNDPEAVRVTSENARLNHLDDLIQTHLGEGFDFTQSGFDLITANILAGPLSEMAPDAMSVLLPGGFIILSGLLKKQAQDVIKAYQKEEAQIEEELTIGEWSTLIMRKDANG